MVSWRNWSGSVQTRPREVLHPATTDEVARIVSRAHADGATVRPVGSGHSFTPVAATDDLLVSLDRLRGIVEVDPDAQTATIRGGTTLHELSPALLDHGLALKNLGDIDTQAVVGAFITGTHGTGADLGIIATQVSSMTLVTGTGEVVTCSADERPDLFAAARVSLGALGIVTEVTLEAVPAYRLHMVTRRERLDAILTDLPARVRDNRHFEFFWFPHTDSAQVKYANMTDAPADERGVGTWLNEVVIENAALKALSGATKLVPSAAPWITRLTAAAIPATETVAHSHEAFATPRLVRFQEMEYNIPVGELPDVLREVRTFIDRQRTAVNFPVEVRFVKGDDIWLSPAHGRDSAYVAVHMYEGMPYRDYFLGVQSIMRAHGGRPHWGKMHSLWADELATMYPRWDDFGRVRAEADPDGVFLSPYLRRLLGAEA